ncbi:lysophospholipid acyltransferase family protein [Brumimicrobium salinarum]|nr:lysophospholipid acyltransferase family protein [Brumimicrobium salinarum]
MKYITGTLYYLWKIYIGIAFAFTLVIFYPILLFFIYNSSLKQFTFRVNICWSRCMRILCFYAVEETFEDAKIKGPFVLVANHSSYLDIFLLYSILPHHQFLFMGKSEILKYPLVKTFFKGLNIPVDRSSSIKSARAFIQARKEINKNWSIVIFPEGGIPDDAPQLAPFKSGAFQLAQAAKCPILPITFINHYYLFSDPDTFCAPAKPGLAKVHIHCMISAHEVVESDVETLKEKTYRLIKSQLPQKNA